MAWFERWWLIVPLRLRSLFRRHQAEQDLNDELQFHIDQQTQHHIDHGFSREQAQHRTRREMYGIGRVKDACRDARRLQWLEDAVTDARYAVRTMRRSPGFTVVALTMLAVGIGLNVTVFTVTNAVLFKGSRSIDRNDRIVYIGAGGPCCVSYSDFEDWRAQATCFEGMGAVADLRITLSDDRGVAETRGATQVSADTFRLIGQRPIIGRDFVATDETPAAAPVAILSYGFWERRYERDPAIIGETVRINGVSTTVIGVMAEGFAFPQQQDLWVPLVPTPRIQKRDARGLWFAFGRMKDGVTAAHARAEMETIGQRVEAAYPDTNRGFAPVVMNFQQFYFGPNTTATYAALWSAVGFVLLIACANLANLFLARSMSRSREMLVRVALGAGRLRLIRQLLIESVMLSAVGGVFGWWMARWGVRAYELVATPPTLSWSDHLLDYSFDTAIFTYILAISLGTGLLFGLAPALWLSRVDAPTTLKDGGRGATGGARGTRWSALLVIGEIALAVVLVAGAGVMTRSFLNVYTADVGVKPTHILTLLLTLPDNTYAGADSQVAFFDRLTTRLQALPGIESVATAWRPPTSGALNLGFEVAGAAPVDAQRRPMLSTLVVSPAYFRTLGASVLLGRDFTDADSASGAPVVIVNQRFASTQWPGEDPLGKRLRFYEGTIPDAWRTVVGVASNIVQNPTREEFDRLAYVPFRQRATASMWVFARTRVHPASLGPAVRREIHGLDANLPIWLGPFTLSERLAAMYWNRGLNGALLMIFATVALLLASAGLSAVIGHSVSRRTQEFGVRMAMGATARDILRLVMTQGLRQSALGLTIGLAAAVAVNRVLKSQLVQVSPADPLTLVAVCVVLILGAMLGCWIPARRAMGIDPLDALRHE